MWTWWIIGSIVFLGIGAFLYGLISISPKTDDYEDQKRAIEQWRARKENRHA